MKTKTIAVCAIFAAIMCVFSVITVPIGPVPVTLGFFGVMITSVILGARRGAVSVAVFILMGAVGLPVFSGFKGGFEVLLGPTGGYIWSYVPMAVLIGLVTAKDPTDKRLAVLKAFLACIGAALLGYAVGTLQFVLVQETTFTQALTVCVVPFIPFDIAKAAAAAYLGCTVKTALKKSGTA